MPAKVDDCRIEASTPAEAQVGTHLHSFGQNPRRVVPRGQMLHTIALWSLTLGLSLLAGCHCSKTSGEVDNLSFKRCAQVAPPAERTLRTGQLELALQERVLTVRAEPGLRVVAFTGPVGGTLSRADYAQLSAQKPGLILYLGGLGDDVSQASANLLGLSALNVPTLFVAGGADRLPIVEEAFGALPEDRAQLMLHASGLREMQLGSEHFAIVPGAPLGRYAIDEEACGFTVDDINDVRDAVASAKDKRSRVWLLSWGAPSGWGVTHAAGVDVGSPELFALGQALSAQRGVFAYPALRAGETVRSQGGAETATLSVVVPRLGRLGSTRGNGGRVPSSLSVLVLTKEGLIPAA